MDILLTLLALSIIPILVRFYYAYHDSNRKKSKANLQTIKNFQNP